MAVPAVYAVLWVLAILTLESKAYAFSNNGHTFALGQYPYRYLSHSKSSFNVFEEGSVANGRSIT